MARRGERRREAYDPDADLREDYEGDETPSSRQSGRLWIPTTVIATVAAVAVGYTYLGRYSLILLAAIPVVVAVRVISRSGFLAARRTHQDLVRRCGGDIGMADRLIRGEMARDPNVGRREAAARALWALTNDRSR